MRGLESLQIGAKLGEGWSVERVCERCGELEGECVCQKKRELKAPDTHRLSGRIEKRRGKSVSVVGEFFIEESEMKKHLKSIKSILGCGGTYKEGFVELQGERVEAALEFFKKAGFGMKPRK